MNVDGLFVISGMAIVTLASRVGGFWLMNHSKSLKSLERILKHTPGSIISAIVAPAALLNGLDDALAAVIVAFVMIRSQNLLLSMSAGFAAILILRYFL